MSVDNDVIYDLYTSLNNSGRLAYFNSNKSELVTRCPHCGDSTSNLNHGHLYISTVAPFSWFCQRCETKGYLNTVTIRDFEIDDPALTVEINKIANAAIKNTTKTFSGGSLITGKRKLILPEYKTETKSFNRKLTYLEERFDTSFSLDDLKALKIIMSPNDFIKCNHLTNMDKYYRLTEYNANLRKWLQLYSIGFLSTDTNYINYRHTKLPGNDRRYYTESNNRPVDIGSRIFTIENEIDLFSNEITLVLAEGVMDITSIWINLYDKLRDPNVIFGAVNGRAYKLFINTMRKMGFFTINLELYSDSEIPLSNYKYNLNLDHFSKVQIHYNTFKGEKDFGVNKNCIKKKTYKLK